MSITKSTLSKTTINEIVLGEPANPTVANRPHQNLETNINDILDYLKNDGAGSLMDSDMLDGQQGAFYQNASNLNAGTLPAARFTDVSHGNRSGGSLHSAVTTTTNGFMSSGDKSKLNGIENGATADQTAAEILAALLTVDGSSSGLDSEYLAGQNSSYYTNIPARLGYTPVNQAGDTMGNPLSGPNAVTSSQYIPLGQADARYGRMTSGTRMLFSQSAAPTGWTQDTSVNDRVLRVVSGAGAGTGGSWDITGLTVHGHALTIAEMPSHTHSYNASRFQSGGSTGNTGPLTTTENTSATGGGNAHSHAISSSSSWRPAYLDVISAIKN